MLYLKGIQENNEKNGALRFYNINNNYQSSNQNNSKFNIKLKVK